MNQNNRKKLEKMFLNPVLEKKDIDGARIASAIFISFSHCYDSARMDHLKNPKVEKKYQKYNTSCGCFNIHRLAIQICCIFFVFL